MKWKEQWQSKALATTKQVRVCPLERGSDGLNLPLGERLSGSVLTWVIIHLNPFHVS
jgi:hypothetical protein